MQDNFSTVTLSANPKRLTLHCDEEYADFVILCCVAGVVGDSVSSSVKSICSRHTIFGHAWYHTRVISGNHWCPVYCGIVFRPVCILFDVTGASNAKGRSLYVCKYLDINFQLNNKQSHQPERAMTRMKNTELVLKVT